MGKLSIIIPVYFSEDTLLDCYNDIKETVVPKLERYEIVLVDDGSEDNSYKICCDIAAQDENVKVLKLSRNFGSHAACFAGMVACTGDCCAIKAADLQESSSLLLDMYTSWTQGNKVVLAIRQDREESFSQKLFANFYYSLVRKFVSNKMPSGGFDCYLIDRRVIEALKLLDERNSAITLQILWSGFKTATVPYTRLARQKGESKWTLSKKIKLVMDSFINFSPMLIRFIEVIGALFAFGAVVWGVALVALNLTGIINVEGWTTLMVILLFASGAIMFTLGVLGEYMWRILDVSQNRPVYFIEEEIRNETINSVSQV